MSKMKLIPDNECHIMNIDEYQNRTNDTANYSDYIKDLTFEKAVMSYLSLGIAGEGGEIANKMKKYIRGDFDLMADETKKKDIAMEVGDVIWYAAQLLEQMGFSFSEVATANILKLKKRKEQGLIRGDGDERGKFESPIGKRFIIIDGDPKKLGFIGTCTNHIKDEDILFLEGEEGITNVTKNNCIDIEKIKDKVIHLVEFKDSRIIMAYLIRVDYAMGSWIYEDIKTKDNFCLYPGNEDFREIVKSIYRIFPEVKRIYPNLEGMDQI